jgi:hypothetical protein
MSEMVEIERDLEQARENLNRTVEEMNRKATSATELLPEQPIRRYPIASLCGALALGLAAGGAPTPAVIFGIVAIGALIAPKDPPSTNGSGQ